MRIFVDLDTQKLIASPGLVQEITTLNFKRSPYANVEVQFTRNGTVIELANDATGVWGVKPAGKYDADYVTAALAWVKTGSGETTVYTFIFTFITSPLDTLFAVDSNADNDVPSLTLMGELQWTVGGSTLKTPTINVVVANDINRGGETTPSLPPVAYGVYLPTITGLVGGTPTDLDSIETVGLITGMIVQVLIEVSGEFSWLSYVLTDGPATDTEPSQVEPLDYDVVTNDRHWRGAVGPSGPHGVHAGSPYLWNTSTATTDPGAGKVKVNNATLASATELYISEADDLGNALAPLIATWEDGTSIVRGRLMLHDPSDRTNFAIFDITGVMVDNGAWDTFTIVHVASGGALTNNLPVQVFFTPTGDKGDQGDPGFKFLFNSAIAADPGSGKLLFNNATFASATSLLISETDANSNAISALLAAIDNGTSPNKCLVIAKKIGGTAFKAFYITGVLTDNGAYDTFPITPIGSSGSFVNGDALFVTFSVVGDLGAAGADGDDGGTGPTGPEAALHYLWNTNTASSDPGSGKVKVNNATLASATALYVSETDNDANALSALLATWDDSTSTIKGQLLVHDPTTPSNFVIFAISGTLTDNGGWDTFSIAYVSGGGTLTNDMPVSLVFIRAGDRGDAGSVDLTQNAQNAAYTFVIGDSGKHIFHDEVTARIYTIPANASVAFPVGTTITIVNNNGAGAITLAITSDTLRRGDGTAGTGSRTIPADAIATVLKTKSTEWIIAGVFT